MPRHVVVDGSNLATEGRPHPSLAQLNEAALAYMPEHPDARIPGGGVAPVGHRSDPREVPEFDAAVANNELVAPPAGAIGRGDAFLLAVANRVDAIVLSNDSFQEFHGTYTWLFDEGRLVGGKPVPHVGWVFVDRAPVRGPISRSAVKKAKRDRGTAEPATVRVGSAEASKPMPVPPAPPPGPARGRKRGVAAAATEVPPAAAATPVAKGSPAARGASAGTAAPAPAPAPSATPAKGAPTTVNDPGPFLAFVAQHPLGTSVNAVVESYSSHGAYVRIGDVRGYVPLRLMADPAPRSAREFMKIGDAVTLAVESFAPDRRSIDLAAPAMASHRAPEQPADASSAAEAAPAKRSRAKKATAAAPAAPAEATAAPGSTETTDTPAAAPAKRTRATRATRASAPVAEPAPGPAPEPATPVKRTLAKKAAPASTAPEPAPAEDAPDTTPRAPAKRARAPRSTSSRAASAAPAPTEAEAAPARRRRTR